MKPKSKVLFVSLGCDKNRVDSEEMLGHLAASGFSFTDDETEAEIIVVNTCCFIDEAKEESIETILDLARMKEEGCLKRLVVCGCMAERYRKELQTELPEVDAICGVNELQRIITACAPDREEDASGNSPEECSSGRVITTPGHYEFLKIAEGCNKRCTYCIIPAIRGGYRSFTMEHLLDEAKRLAEQGVKELILVAQETSIYGKDLYGEEKLPALLKKLCLIEGLSWIRVLYCYPEDITEEFLHVMAEEEKIVNYIDMPIQHAANRILKRMGRRTTKESILETIALCRKIVPDVALRTSLISGFPGESDEEHQELLDFVRTVRFDHLGVFTYSREEGTPAYDFEGQIEEEIKEARRAELMQLQEGISKELLAQKAGSLQDVLVEGKLTDEEVYVGRTRADAPDVDSLIYFPAEEELMTGDLVRVRVTSSSGYDLYGSFTERI